MTIGAHALALRGERSVAPRLTTLPDAPERVTILLLIAARLASGIAVTTLALLSPDRDLAALVALFVVATVALVGTSGWLWRSPAPAQSGVLRPALVVDLLLWLAACVASGGADSPALLLYAVLPTIGALVLDVGWLVGCALLVAGVRVLLGGPADDIVVFCTVGAWATAIGIAASRGRRVFGKRIARLDAVWTAVAGGHGPSEVIRERVADDLRERALRPVVEVRNACAADGSPTTLSALANRMSTVIARTRAIAHELHAPAALHGGVEESVRHIAQLRAPAADVAVRVDGDVPASLAEPLDAVVRDALGIVAGTWTRELVVRIATDDESVQVEVTATPLLDFDSQRRALRRAALASRAEVDHVDVAQTEDGGVGVALRLHEAPTPEPGGAPPVRQFRELGPYVATARIGMVPVLVAVALVVGGTDRGFWPVLAALCVHLIAFGVVLRRPRSTRLYLLVGGVDYALLAAGFALAGDAQPAFVAVALLLPTTNAAIFHWWMIVPVTLLAVAVIAVASPDLPQPAVSVALLWAAVVAFVESTARTRDAERLFSITRRRSELLRGLLQEEEAERRRIAGQLHDDVLQRLFVVRQDLEEAAADADDERARAQALGGLEAVTTVLTRTVRDLDVDEGAVAVAGGLRAALETTTALREGADVDLAIDPRAVGLNDGLIVQFVRELYANVTRHAGAQRIRISVSRQFDTLVLDVVDDGVGFEWPRVHEGIQSGRLGLATVRARAEHLGGSILLGDAPKGGAHVQVRLPLRAPDDAARPVR